MFERYTEKARRVIFFARYEASQFGAHAIEAEHILLGLLREDKELAQRFFADPHSTLESIRKEIESINSLRVKISSSVDLPLSESAKRVLKNAADESDRLGHRHIGTEHLLLGILQEENSTAAKILYDRGLRLNQAREQLIRPAISETEMARADEPRADPAEQLLSMMSKLLELLARRGVFTREEFKGAPARPLLFLIQDSFNLLLDLLVSKGVISEEEKRDIVNTGR